MIYPVDIVIQPLNNWGQTSKFKGDDRLGRNDVKVAEQAGKGKRKFSSGLPLMQCVLVKTASGVTGNASGPALSTSRTCF